MDELLAKKRKQNARKCIPALRGPEIQTVKTETMGFSVLQMLHPGRAKKANLFPAGGGCGN